MGGVEQQNTIIHNSAVLILALVAEATHSWPRMFVEGRPLREFVIRRSSPLGGIETHFVFA